MITKAQTKKIAKKFMIDLKVVPLDVLQYGLNVELEHGRETPLTNVTDDDLIKTAKIAIAHLLEYPDYYQRLKKMEKHAEKDWSKRTKPCIFKYCTMRK